MKILASLILCLALILAAAGCGRFDSRPASQRRAEALAAGTLKSLGGRHALAGLRYLAFDFVIRQGDREVLRRSHTWDRETGRYRLEGIAPDGQPYVALFNVNTRQGKVFTGNAMEPLADPRAAIEESIRNYQSDTAWLLAFLRLRDPGVQLDVIGQESVGERTYQIVSVTAGGPAGGTLPGIQNWAYLDPDGGKPLGWAFMPPGSRERVIYLISAWQPVGKLMLPIRFDRAGSPWAIVINRLIALGSVTRNVFESVKDPLLQKKVQPLQPGEKPPPLVMP